MISPDALRHPYSEQYSDCSDDALVECAKKGNADEFFPLLLLCYKKRITEYLRQIVHNDEIAEELWRDTCIKVWRHIESLNKVLLFKAWLFAIARKLAIDWLRKDRRKRRENWDISDPIDPHADVIAADRLRFVPEEIGPMLLQVLPLSMTGYSRTEITYRSKESTITTNFSKACERFQLLYYLIDSKERPRFNFRF